MALNSGVDSADISVLLGVVGFLGNKCSFFLPLTSLFESFAHDYHSVLGTACACKTEREGCRTVAKFRVDIMFKYLQMETFKWN